MMRGFRSAFSIPLVLALAGTPFLRAGEVLTAADGLARQHLHYIYGSEDFHNGGLDCSGFVQVVFHEACGIDLPNEADKQLDYCREHGQVWDSTSGWTPATLQPGDLIFYAGPDPLPRASLVSHVMLYCGNGVMAGAQGKGRQLDGVYSGVGYYHFWPRVPSGILGESGERFLGHRRVFAYGRLNAPHGPATPASTASALPTPPPAKPAAAGSPASTSPLMKLLGILWRLG